MISRCLSFRSHAVFDRAKRGPASPQRDPLRFFFGSSDLRIFDVSRRRVQRDSERRGRKILK